MWSVGVLGIYEKEWENTGLALWGRHLEVRGECSGGGAGCCAETQVDKEKVSRAKTRKFALVASFSSL
jgi:hypothetical protein